MTLHLLTASGSLALGDPPTADIPCLHCEDPAQVSRAYGWPGDDTLVVDLWAPHGHDVPDPWLDLFLYIPEFERRRALQEGR